MSRTGRLQWGDALALIISLVFCAFAVLLLMTGDPEARRIAIGALAFFGGCALVLAGVWRRRRAEDRSRPARAVSIVGGVPLRVRTGRLVTLGVGLIVVGAVYAWAFGGDGATGWVLGGIQVASGVLLLAVVVWRGRTRGLRFEPDALHLIDGGIAFAVPWEEIAAVSQVELHSNAFVALALHDAERVLVRAQARRRNGADATGTLRKLLARNREWVGADVWIPAELYGLDAVLLTAAIRRYAEEPAARAELGVRPLPAAAA